MNNEAPYYVIFFILLLIISSYIQMFSSALCFETLSICVLFNARASVSYTYKTRRKIIVLCILTFEVGILTLQHFRRFC
jgi:hypothetical protein